MDKEFQIPLGQLEGGQSQKIERVLPPDFLEVCEKELWFEAPVYVNGKAYLCERDLILTLSASTEGMMPCAVCNQMYLFELRLKDLTHAEPIEQIPTGVFDYRSILRMALLLEIPRYGECRDGGCPDRALIAPYLRSPQIQKTHFPFKDL